MSVNISLRTSGLRARNCRTSFQGHRMSREEVTMFHPRASFSRKDLSSVLAWQSLVNQGALSPSAFTLFPSAFLCSQEGISFSVFLSVASALKSWVPFIHSVLLGHDDIGHPAPRGHSAPSLSSTVVFRSLWCRKTTAGVGQALSPRVGVNGQIQTSLGLLGQFEAPPCDGVAI